MFLHANDKSVIALWPCAILTNILLVSHIFTSRGKFAKCQKLVKCLSHCTRHLVITSA